MMAPTLQAVNMTRHNSCRHNKNEASSAAHGPAGAIYAGRRGFAPFAPAFVTLQCFS
jgi:hypothetical protein